ncbi:U4/U6 small nuclear ribonucleoprotein Prp31-like [Dysidea avara]|uniref:U4/U6 small nuclear ribonucleoprotein Prp31-like n=1 Tax=Dysidea avara TaxID=196820 RepID=UPI003325DF3A
MSLADELLADLDEVGNERDEVEQWQNEDEMEVPNEAQGGEAVSDKSVKSMAKLLDSRELLEMVKQIGTYMEKGARSEVLGPVEADPEYQLIVESNNMLVELDTEINVIHKFTRDNYAKRFPELESLIHTPMEYIKTVKALGNDLQVTKSGVEEFLPAATVMVVSVTASTTQGQRIEQEELDLIFEACDMAESLNEIKLHILEYVESRMTFISPNLSQIVGSTVAAKLMGIAGGLTSLSKMPACNIQVLGAQKKTLSGFSSATVLPHTGLVFYSEMVQSVPADLQRKAARIVASKCALAARVDSFHESPLGEAGKALRDEIQKKLDKMQEPPRVKQVKPLPKPDDAPRKKRGGKRMRKIKERYGITDLRKHANRMTFGEIEQDAYQDDLGFSTGWIGKSSSGKVRGPAASDKTQVSISKRLQRRLQQQQVYGGKTSVRGMTSGTASSIAFTPLQGLEIVNPMAAEKKVQEANQKYFSSTSGFQYAKAKQTDSSNKS